MRFKGSSCCRTISLEDSHVLNLPILIINEGGRHALVTVDVRLLPHQVHVIDVATETMDRWVYAHDYSRLNRTLRTVPLEVIQAYENYLQDLPDWGDVSIFQESLRLAYPKWRLLRSSLMIATLMNYLLF